MLGVYNVDQSATLVEQAQPHVCMHAELAPTGYTAGRLQAAQVAPSVALLIK